MISNGEIITLKDNTWLKRQKEAGHVLSSLHQEFFKMFKGKAALKISELDKFAFEYISNNNCSPTFLGYNGFPSTICASLNKELVHGFGNREINLVDGDIITIDVGTTFEGAIADCAFTYIYGKLKNNRVFNMLKACQDSLDYAVLEFKPGNKIGNIGNSIFESSKKSGFGVVVQYGGHGINYDQLHATPFVPNKSRKNDGVGVYPGMSIAIEPMFVLGKNTNTKVKKDNWTIISKDFSCHYEHSVTLDLEGNRHIITDHKIKVGDFV